MISAQKSLHALNRLAFGPRPGDAAAVRRMGVDRYIAQQLDPESIPEPEDLGPAYDDTVILVISEFGRTVHENGNGGTDHGHGNVMWAMGGPVRGRRIYTRWKGRAPADLYEERDIAVTTDFREPIGRLLQAHMGLAAGQIDRIFPGRQPDSGNTDGLIRTWSGVRIQPRIARLAYAPRP